MRCPCLHCMSECHSALTRSDASVGVVWEGWGHASARPGSLAEAAVADERRRLPAPAPGGDPARCARPYMQLAAVWLATLDAHAQAQCLLEAQLLPGGLAPARQVSTSQEKDRPGLTRALAVQQLVQRAWCPRMETVTACFERAARSRKSWQVCCGQHWLEIKGQALACGTWAAPVSLSVCHAGC